MISARRSAAVVDLQFLAGFHLQPPERQLRPLTQLPDEPADRAVLAREPMLLAEILIDSLGRQALLEFRQDRRLKGTAKAPRDLGSRIAWEPLRTVLRALRPGGRFGIL